MIGIEEGLLVNSISDTFDRIAHIATKQGHIIFRHGDVPSDPDSDETWKFRDLKSLHALAVQKLLREMTMLAERLGLNGIVQETAELASRSTELADISQDEEGDGFHSTSATQLRPVFDSMETLFKGRRSTGIGVLETILENSSRIVQGSGIIPKSESEVRNEVLKVLEFAFLDVKKEVSVPKTFKSYKPDIGVSSLMAAAEYKFITSRQGLLKAMDEVYTDLKGYSGSPDWRTFYAVFYQTEQFAHHREIENELRLLPDYSNWKPIVVVGPGQRRQRNKSKQISKDLKE